MINSITREIQSGTDLGEETLPEGNDSYRQVQTAATFVCDVTTALNALPPLCVCAGTACLILFNLRVLIQLLGST